MATKTQTEAPVCTRCKGTGHEPVQYRPRQLAILGKLAELGEKRAPLVARKAYMTTGGRQQLGKLYADARQLLEAGEEQGLRAADMMSALGVTSPAYYKIKNGLTGA